MEKTIFEVIASDRKTGIGRNDQPYVIETLTVNFNGKAATVRKPKGAIVNVGDSVRIGLGTVRGYGRAAIGAVVTEVIPAEKKGEK